MSLFEIFELDVQGRLLLKLHCLFSTQFLKLLALQGHPMDLFLKISVLHAKVCWLGDVEEIIVLGRKVLLGKKIIQGVRGDLKSRIAAMGYLYGLLTTQDLN